MEERVAGSSSVGGRWAGDATSGFWCTGFLASGAELPSGTVTFLFTDLESSSRLWETHPGAMKAALARHDAILREAVESNCGHVVKMTGDGVHAAFATAEEALAAAVAAQLGLGAEAWQATGPLRVRMGIHSGAAESRGGDYFGPVVNRAARIMSIAHGGQIVVSHATEQLVSDALGAELGLIDLGEHRLRDLGRPEHVFQVTGPGLQDSFPSLQFQDRLPGRLPENLTSFVGRERELGAVIEALRRSRIVTIVGAGGVGKTRLALQAAAEALPEYRDDAWFCELEAVTDREAVPEAVAAALELRPQPTMPPTANLLAFLRQKQLLLVLDNCEHLVEAAGALAEAISHACPDVAILATSREALAVEGELLRPLGPLLIPTDLEAPVDQAAAASVRLFVDRARAVRPDFDLESSSLAAVVDICRRLDGVPLAIELAAARVAALGVADIARRLDQRFRLLTGGRRTAMERHQTLGAAIDWSYDLLDDTQARAFNRLAVFAGGCTLDAAEELLSGDGVSREEVLDVVSSLVARSMVVADESDPATRYRLLETMRQYARERLDHSGEGDVVRHRHAEYYVVLAELAAARIQGRDEERWVRTVDLEVANFRAALDWSVDRGDADLALRFTVAVGGFGLWRPRYGIAQWNERVLQMPEARDHPLRPHAAALAAQQDILLGDPALLSERVRLMDQAFDEADLELSAIAHFVHVALASIAGEWDEGARQHAVTAIDVSLRAGDRFMACVHSAMVAMFFATASEFDDAVRNAEHAVDLASEVMTPSLIAMSETALGYALSTVDPERAIPHLELASTQARTVGNQLACEVSERCLARLLAARGDLFAALEIYRSRLESGLETGGDLQLMLACESIAVDLAAAGYTDVAATLLGGLEAPDGGYQGNPLRNRHAAIDGLKHAMGPQPFEGCTARGRAMDIHELAKFARAALIDILSELRRN